MWLGVSVTWPSGVPSRGLPLLDGASVEVQAEGLSNQDVAEMLSGLALQHARAAVIEEQPDDGALLDVEASARMMVIHEVVNQQVDAERSD